MRSDPRRAVTVFTSAIIASGVSILLWSCIDIGTAPGTSRVSDSVARHAQLPAIGPEQTGSLHNEALDRVLADFESSAAAGKLNSGNVQMIARASFDRYFQSRGYGGIPDGKWTEGVAFGHATPNDWRVAKRDGRLRASGRASSYLDQVLSAASNATSVAALIATVEGIESSARSELAGTDLNVVLASASVAKSSAQYWSVKAERWRSVLCSAGACGHVASAGSALSRTSVLMTSTGPIVSSISSDFPDGWKVLFADIFGALMGGLAGAAIASMVAFIAQL